MLCTQEVWERGLKKFIFLQSYSQQHDSHWPTNRSNPSVHGSQFHKQTVVYTQWNMTQPLKVGNSDNATMWTKLMVIILSEINQTNKGQTFCDSTSMRYPNKSNPKPEKAKSDPQESKRIHVAWTPLSIPWGNWLPMTSLKPIIQITGSHIQSNECRHKFTIYTNLTQTSQQTKGKTVSMVPQLCLKLYL